MLLGVVNGAALSSSFVLCEFHDQTKPKLWVLPPLTNSWILVILWLYIALNRTPNIDCYWVGAVEFAKKCLDLLRTTAIASL